MKIMLKLKFDDQYNYICESEINLGFLGLYKKEMIEIYGELDRFDLARLEGKGRKKEINKICTEKDELISMIIKNNDLIKSQFIIWLLLNMVENSFEFWKDQNTFTQNRLMPEIIDEKNIYNIASKNNYEDFYSDVYNFEIDEDRGKTLFEKYLPMIDVEKIIQSIKPTYLILNEYGLLFEINSNECEGELINSLVGRLNKECILNIIDD